MKFVIEIVSVTTTGHEDRIIVEHNPFNEMMDALGSMLQGELTLKEVLL